MNAHAETWIDDTGQRVINVHDENEECHEFGCAIHCPSEHELEHLPRHWSNLLAMIVRVDDEGTFHVDPDEFDYRLRHPDHPYRPGYYFGTSL